MSLEFMIEMAWKSALIAGVALGLVALLRSRAAADRAAVLRVSVALLLLLPLFSLGLPKLKIEAWAAEEAAALPDLSALAFPQERSAAPGAIAPRLDPMIWDDPTILFLILYLGGVAMLTARLIAGLWTLRRWTRAASEADCPAWTEAFERTRWAAGAPQRLRLLVSDETPSPLSWGLFRPVILIDRDTLEEPGDADAVLAHEIAHVVRRDWLVLMLTRVAAALFWFNPLVWVLEREVVQQAEEAADIEAALCVEPTRYAQTLVHWAQFNAGSLLPANSIAPSASALARRVRAILDARRRATPTGSPWTHAAIGGCALFAVTLAVLQLIPAVAEARDAAVPHAPAAPRAPAGASVPAAPFASPAAPAAPTATLVVNGVAPLPELRLAALAPLHPHPETPPLAPTPPVPPRAGHAPHPPRVMVRPGPVVVPHVDTADIERRVEAAVAAAERSGAVAEAAARSGIAAGAIGLERGAVGLERGAQQMEREARQLRSRDYRERQIAEAARRGERLTHDQLVDLSRELQEGARGMHEGARDMRRAAAEMRREARD
ncbi:MAG TPA: M56 family metallopeptidase [Allosphingosinicella sp.]|jgi:beta-lactamase regulating signal transducer with metallopeptidase domain